MKLQKRRERWVLLTIVLLATAYVGVSIANGEGYTDDVAADWAKLGLVFTLCVVGFVSGREYFRFTHTTPVFLAAMSFLILFHTVELTEEYAVFQSVPLFGEGSMLKRAFETILMIGSICLFLAGNYLSVAEIQKAGQQLESNLDHLQERERRYRALFEAANDAIFIMQGDKIVDCNSRTLEMFGATREQIIGKTTYHFSPPTQPDGQNSKERALHKLDALRAGERRCFDWRHIRYDGTPFDAEVSLNRVELANGPGLQAIVRDVTERNRVADALRESEARFRGIFENATIGLYRTTPDGRILMANPALVHMLGYTSFEELARRNLKQEGFERQYPRTAFLDRIERDGHVTGLESAWVRRDGTTLFVRESTRAVRDEGGKTLFYEGAVEDITERKQAERALRESTARLQSVFDSSPLAITVTHLDGTIMDCNHAALDTYGFAAKGEILGRSIFGFIVERDIARARTKMAELLRQGAIRDVELTLLRKDGAEFTGVLSASVMRDGDGHPLGLVGISADITERKRAERALRDNESFLRDVFNGIQDGISVLDTDLNIVRVNSWMEKMYATQKPLVGKKCYQVYQQRNSPCTWCPSVVAMETGEPHGELVPFPSQENPTGWIDLSAFPLKDATGQTVGIIEHVRDITERKQAEQALRESEQKYRAVVEDSPGLICSYLADGELTFVNNAYCAYFGKTREELTGRKFLPLVPEEDREALIANIAALTPGAPVHTHEHRVIRPDGSIRWNRWTNRALFDEAGRVVAYQSFGEDITEHKQAEEAMQRLATEWHTTFDAATDAICILDPQQRIQRCNQAMCREFGQDANDIVGRYCWEVVHRGSGPVRHCAVQRMRESLRRESMELSRAGRWFEVTADPILDEAGSLAGAVHIMRDITERKKAERALRESEQRMELALRGADLGTWDWNVITGEVAFNPRWAEMLGYRPEEIQPHVSAWETLIHPDDAARVHEILQAHLQGKTDFYETEHRLAHKSGEWVWVLDKGRVIDRDADGRPLRACGTHLDITAQHQVQEALRHAEESYRVFLENFDGIAYQASHLTFRPAFFYGTIEEITGHTADDFTSGRLKWSDLIHPDDLHAVRETGRRVRDVPGFTADTEYRIVTRDQQVRWVRDIGRALRTQDGQTHLVQGAIYDITARKRIDAERLDYERKLRSLASELSLAEERERHRIATGLHDHACQTLVLSKMRLQGLGEPLRSSDRVEIATICNTLDKTIESVRELVFDLSSPTLYKFGLEAALEELLEDKLKAKHGIRCTFSTDGAPKPLADDVRTLLFQSVRELIINIIKHARAREVTLDISRFENSIRITITDDGVGFHVEEVLTVPSRSRGFGLFNVRERLDFIGGRLAIDSHPGAGSRVTLVAGLAKETHHADQDSAG